MSPFDFVTAINSTKKNLINEDPALEKEYNPFLTNKALSYFTDTIMDANQMNMHHGIDKKLQFDYLINIVRPGKRFSKWAKRVENNDRDLVKTYYGYNDRNAEVALSLLSAEQLKIIRERLENGGVKK
ncbi:DNA polymerase [uncultured phage]|nr:DNA polymerase [uncultured phage]